MASKIRPMLLLSFIASIFYIVCAGDNSNRQAATLAFYLCHSQRALQLLEKSSAMAKIEFEPALDIGGYLRRRADPCEIPRVLLLRFTHTFR